MWLWDFIASCIAYVGLRKNPIRLDNAFIANQQFKALKPSALYSRYDVDPQTWVNEPPPAKLFQLNDDSLLDPINSEYDELSKKRKLEHKRIFNKKPQKCTKLKNISNVRINQMINVLANDPKGPFVIPTIIDHWTTVDNFKSVLNRGAFLGNQSLTQKNITFTKNALDTCDVENGDGDVICFASGGFVDYGALRGPDRIRVRIDARKLQNIKYNTFFKAVDLCVGAFSIEIQLTAHLKVKITHPNDPKLQFDFILQENKNICMVSAELSKDELMFYGNIFEINKASLILPFLALEKGVDKAAVKVIYEYLNALDDSLLRKIMIGLSQNATMYSEFNIFSKLQLTPHLIYDIHFVKEKKTYLLHNLSEEDYKTILLKVINAKLDFLTETVKTEEAVEIVSNQRTMIVLYGRWITGHLDRHEEQVDITNVPSKLFEESYIETRPGIRKVY